MRGRRLEAVTGQPVRFYYLTGRSEGPLVIADRCRSHSTGIVAQRRKSIVAQGRRLPIGLGLDPSSPTRHNAA